MEIFVIIFFGIIIPFVIYSFSRAVWSLFDHTKWSKDSYPNYGAQIVNITTDKVQYVKNGAKYKTTVFFQGKNCK